MLNRPDAARPIASVIVVGSGGFLDDPFAKDLGGTLFADFHHVGEAPFRTFLDAAIEVASCRPRLSRSSVLSKPKSEPKPSMSAAPGHRSRAKVGQFQPRIVTVGKRCTPAVPLSAASGRIPIQTTKAATATKASELMMPPRLRVSVSMRPGRVDRFIKQLVLTKSMAVSVITSPRVGSRPTAEVTIFCMSANVGVDLRLIDGLADHCAIRPVDDDGDGELFQRVAVREVATVLVLIS